MPENEEHQNDQKKDDVETNPELGIKRVRTLEEDLRLAKEKAGVKDEPKQQKKKGFFQSKKEQKKEAAPPPKKEAPEEVPQKEQAPDRQYIEQELARSGIIAEEPKEEEEQAEEANVSAIRTYKYDAAENIQNKGVSRVKMAAAEQQRRAKNKDFSYNEPTPIGTNIIYVIISIVLVFAGAGGLWYFYSQTRVDDTEAITPNQDILLFTNAEQTIAVGDQEGVTFTELLAEAVRTANTAEGDIVELQLQESGLFGQRPMTAQSFLERLRFVPGSLVRNVNEDILLGVHQQGTKEPLLILKTETFDTIFAGMLAWEATMSEDLAPLFGPAIEGAFEDVILRNKDTRLLRDQNGTTRLLYAFPNTETVVITTNEETFFEVFERLSASNATRSQ